MKDINIDTRSQAPNQIFDKHADEIQKFHNHLYQVFEIISATVFCPIYQNIKRKDAYILKSHTNFTMVIQSRSVKLFT